MNPFPLRALSLWGVVSLAPLLAAEPLPKLTVERIHSEPSLSGTLPSRLQWHADGKRLTFLRRSGEGSAALQRSGARMRVE